MSGAIRRYFSELGRDLAAFFARPTEAERFEADLMKVAWFGPYRAEVRRAAILIAQCGLSERDVELMIRAYVQGSAVTGEEQK